MSYIYLTFSDLSEEKQQELCDLARDEVIGETEQSEADDLGMDIDDLIDERTGSKLASMSAEGRFVFNI